MNEVDPGEGYRLLIEGELIPKNATYLASGLWHELQTDCSVGKKWAKGIYFPMRVPIEPIDNAGVEATTSGPYVAIEVHRAALAEIERLKAELEAVKQPQTEPEPEWFDLTPFGDHVLRKNIDWGGCGDPVDWRQPNWPPVTTMVDTAKSWGWEQFRCLLKDAPPELVAKANADKCIHTFDCNAGDHSDACPAAVPPKAETVTFHEVIVDSPETNNRYLCWVEHVDRRQGDISTGRTETREVVR